MNSSEIAFVADIGGTNLRIAPCETGNSLLPAPQVLACDDFETITAALREGLQSLDLTPQRGAIAIAGPVTQDRVAMTNGPWTFSIETLRQELGLADLKVTNDLEALAHALPYLAAAELEQIGGNAAANATRAVLAPGTGLGVSGLLPTTDGGAAIAGEGGHVDFAPANEREVQIWRWFANRYAHVSAERLLSGPGLLDLYRATAEVDGTAPARDPNTIDAPTLVELAHNAQCIVAATAVRDFSAMLGAVAGNLALTLGARGGVYLAGGVVTGLGDAFDRTTFRIRFEEKGRFHSYLRQIPCYLVTTAHPALIGLAQLLER